MRPVLNFACEDSRILPITDQQGALVLGIYEVARVDLPESKSYWLRWMNQFFTGIFGMTFDPIPFGPGATFWDLRLDRMNNNEAAPSMLIAAPTGIRGNPVPGFPRRDHVVESGAYLSSFNDLAIEMRGPCMLRLFCEIVSGTAVDLVSYVGGRLVVFSE